MWIGTGLELNEFLALRPVEQRARLCELSDIDQLVFVDKHLDWFVGLMLGFPAEEHLPETAPFEAMKALGVDPGRYGFREITKLSAEIREFPTTRAGRNEWIH